MELNIKPYGTKIELNNGFYVFNGEAASGKTLLCSIIDVARKNNLVKSLVLSYDISLKESDIINRIREDKYDIIIVDRFDMYISENICKALVEVRYLWLYILGLRRGW